MPAVNARWSGLTIDCADPQYLSAFYATLLGWQRAESLPGWVQLVAVDGPVINFQPVLEPKAGKNRLHLDISVDDIEEAVTAVYRLGGRSLNQRHDYDEGIVMVMADPEDNEFCLVQYF
jgi:predicted enzyme related to lactoylglutathione lyase